MKLNSMKTLEGQKTKIDRVARTFRPIFASASDKELPTKVELLRCGMWDTAKKGMFMITPEDLAEYKSNFEAGIAQVIGPEDKPDGLTIEYEHEPGIAAGWITGMEVEDDVLYGIVEWSDQGEKDVRGKNFKYLSPEFYPASRGGWEDPEAWGSFIGNVVAAVGITNRPLFKGLRPIMASANAGNEDQTNRGVSNAVFISASVKEKTMPTLEEVRAKNLAELDDEDKKVIQENKDKLTAEEQEKFGLEVTADKNDPAADPAKPEDKNKDDKEEKVEVDAETAKIAASIKSGESVVIKASALERLEKTASNYEREKAEAVVKAHAAEGKIKADQIEPWTKRLMADPSAEDLLKGMVPNPVLANAQGAKDDKAGHAKDAMDQVHEKTDAAVKASAAEGKQLSYATAKQQVLEANPELNQAYQAAYNKVS
jgi:PHD/YefM family antitoxin component YafN of YafNO toxin-antitoxin module